MTHLHISVPAITRGTLARTHELKRTSHSETADNYYSFETLHKNILLEKQLHLMNNSERATPILGLCNLRFYVPVYF